jgi:hypothetical protein
MTVRRRIERELTLRFGKEFVSSFQQFPLASGPVFMETSGKPDDLPLLFYGSEHRCSLTQAKKKAEITGPGNVFFAGKAGLG